MAVEIFELCEIEPRCAAADRRQIEPFDHLRGRHDFIIAMAPAQPHQIVAQRLGQIAHGAIGLDAERAMPLGQLGAVRAVDQRNVGHVGTSQPIAS